MSSHGRQAQLETSLRRYLVTDDFGWLSLIFRMRAGLANGPEVARPVLARAAIREHDSVRTQRDLTVGCHRIARGTVGTVVKLHSRRPLVEVAFLIGGPVSVTIAGYELLQATA